MPLRCHPLRWRRRDSAALSLGPMRKAVRWAERRPPGPLAHSFGPEPGGVVIGRGQDARPVGREHGRADGVPWPRRTRSSWPEAASQSRAVLSADAVRTRAPSGENTAEQTQSCGRAGRNFRPTPHCRPAGGGSAGQVARAICSEDPRPAARCGAPRPDHQRRIPARRSRLHRRIAQPDDGCGRLTTCCRQRPRRPARCRRCQRAPGQLAQLLGRLRVEEPAPPPAMVAGRLQPDPVDQDQRARQGKAEAQQGLQARQAQGLAGARTRSTPPQFARAIDDRVPIYGVRIAHLQQIAEVACQRAEVPCLQANAARPIG